MTITPAFLPEELISLEQARDEVGAAILGTLLVSNRLKALCFDPFGHCTPIHSTVWGTDAGRQIMDAGVVPFGIAQQVGIQNYRDEDIGTYVDKHALFANIEVVTEDDESAKVEEKPKNKGGRPSADWDAVFIAAACHIATDGLPATQSEFIGVLQEKLGAKAPGDTQMKERIGPLFNAVRKALTTG
ncbi:hypothetical protein [Methylobacterium sp. E-066]|uniref:hypothetical protein n=1 Tax=Methylobacterium sp. E-066 TaxID=2836584 RepID=UPI001FBA2155|nr:hypothetical protein [Methylobacterium sp. E-066]MCJ2144719.1 hypothetical protein [Methylobacterium sp. E-066]